MSTTGVESTIEFINDYSDKMRKEATILDQAIYQTETSTLQHLSA